MWYIVLGSIAAASAVAAICVYAKSRRTLTEADKMIDAAISGNFVESNFSEDELAALPLVYKIMLFGGVYYYGTVFRLMDNHDQLKELLEYILNQLFTDQIDFGKILAKTNK